jgi:hypothetical protein
MGWIKENFKRVVLREFVAQESYLRTCPCCKKKGVDSADLAQGARCLHCGKIIEVDFFYAVSFPILLAACLTAAFSYDYRIIGLIITGILLVHVSGEKSINPRFFPLKSYEE